MRERGAPSPSPSLTHQLLLCGCQVGYPRSPQARQLGLQRVDPFRLLLLQSEGLLLGTAALHVRGGLRGQQRTAIPGDTGPTLSSKDECPVETALLLDLLSLRAAEVPWPAQELDSGTGLGAGLGDSSRHQS